MSDPKFDPNRPSTDVTPVYDPTKPSVDLAPIGPPPQPEPGGTGLLQTPQGQDALSALWHGLTHGIGNTLYGGAQLGARMGEATDTGFGPELPPGSAQKQDLITQQREQQFQMSPEIQRNPIASGLGQLTGEAITAAPLSAIPGVGAVGGGALRSGLGLLARGGALGALGAATAPVTDTNNYWSEKGRQMMLGGAIGAAIPGVGSALAPRLPSPDLVSQNALRVFRPLRNFLTGTEERTVDGFDRTIARQVLDPIEGDVPRGLKGHALNSHTEDTIGKAYDQLLPNLKLSRGGALQSGEDLQNIVSELSEPDAKRYTTIIANRLLNKFPDDGIMDGRTFKKVQSDLSRRAFGFIGTNNDDLGQALLQTVHHLNSTLEAENPDFAGQLSRVNESWKLWARMRAASSSATGEGKFTPEQLLRAIRSQDPSAGKGAFSKGDALLQGYSEVGMKALGQGRSNWWDLMKLFSHHGLIAELGRDVVQPVGRALKATTPYVAPQAGRLSTGLPDLNQP